MLTAIGKFKYMIVEKKKDIIGKKVLCIQFDHTGDMYHIKAASNLVDPKVFVIAIHGFGNLNINDKTIVELIKYLEASPLKLVLCKEKISKLEFLKPWSKYYREGYCTSMIKKQASTKADCIKEAIAPFKEIWQNEFTKVSKDFGIDKIEGACLVNWRNSAVHPELNTGENGLDDIISIVKKEMSSSIIVTGHIYNRKNGIRSIGEYYTHELLKGDRAKQASYIRYLYDNLVIKCAIGMRSGVMDSMLFSGIPIMFIDIDTGNNGYARGSKLIEGFPKQAHRATTKDIRIKREIKGAFTERDKKIIATEVRSMNNYIDHPKNNKKSL